VVNPFEYVPPSSLGRSEDGSRITDLRIQPISSLELLALWKGVD
jgi:hypothetical protein